MDVKRLNELTSAQVGLVSWRQMSAAGVPQHRLRTLQRRGVLKRYVRGVYLVVTRAPQGFDANRSRAAWAGLLAADPHGISSGVCALHFHGVHGLPPKLVPEVIVPMSHSGRGPAGVRVRRIPSTFEWIEFNGRKVAGPIPALIQGLPGLEPWRAVAVLDSALNQKIITPDCLKFVREGLVGQRGVAALARCWGLVDGRAGSPVETAVRLECVSEGFPPTDLQVVVHDSWNQFVARGDLGWRRLDGTWVLVEIDGVSVHGRPEALFHDRERQNRIMLAGRHTTLRFTARDVGTGRIVAQIRQALRV